MLEEGGVPGLERRDTPSELLQPLVPRYEEALSLLEKAIKVRGRPRGSSLGATQGGGRRRGGEAHSQALSEQARGISALEGQGWRRE